MRILKQYVKLLELDEVKLVFEDEALEWIAEEAIKEETGSACAQGDHRGVHA